MKLTLHYMAQVRQRIGRGNEEIDLPEPVAVATLLRQLCARHGSDLEPLLLTSDGNIQPALLLFLGDEQVTPSDHVPHREGDVLTILSPMAGG